MAVDPKELIKMAPKKRVQLLKQSPQLLQEMMLTGALTPTDRALLFPDYFKRTIPEHMRTGTGTTPVDMTGSGGRPDRVGTTPDTPGAARGGYTPAYQKPEKKTTINVASTPATPGATPDTPVIQVDTSHLEQGGKGLQDIKFVGQGRPDRVGTTPSTPAPVFGATPVTRSLPTLDAANDRDAAILEHAQKWGIHPSALAGKLDIESGGINTKSRGGAGNRFYGSWQLEDRQIPNLTKKAGLGSMTPEQYRQLSLKDQLKVHDSYMKQWGIEPGFFTGDAAKDASKLWALQLAPANAKKIDYDDPNAVISRTAQAGDISAGRKLVTVGSTQLGTVHRGEKQLAETYAKTGQPSVTTAQTPSGDIIPSGMTVTTEKTTGQKLSQEMMPVAGGGGRLTEKQQQVAGIRKLGLNDKTKNVLEYAAAQAGVEVVVTSGAQMSLQEAEEAGARKRKKAKGKGYEWVMPNGEVVRTGSVRHDDVGKDGFGAGDIKLKKDGKIVNFETPEGKKIMNDFVKHSASAGFTGFGYGTEYMGPTTLHVGGGKYAAWGSGSRNLYKAMEEGRNLQKVDATAWMEQQRKLAVDPETKVRAAETEEEQKVKKGLPESHPMARKTSQQSTTQVTQSNDTAVSNVPKPRPKPTQLTADKSVAPLAPGAPSVTAATPTPDGPQQSPTAPQQQTQYPSNPNDGPQPSPIEPTIDHALLNSRQPQMPRAAASAYARAQLNSGSSPYSKFDSIGGLPSFLA